MPVISMLDFPFRYNEIVAKINAIDPQAYAETRNYTNGAVTYLSPYISRGVISVAQVKDIVLAKGYKLYQAEKLIQELAWREYFQRVWQAKGQLIESDLRHSQTAIAHDNIPTTLIEATTGIHAVDDAIKELYATGYMHNHLRMYTASIACNIAKAYWREPARWLYYHLLDGDIASNNCSWQWVAGAFSSKKYYCNQENINKYTNSYQLNTFLDKPYDELPTTSIPEALTATSNPNFGTHLPTTPLPVIDTSKPILIYNSYNLDPAWRKDEQANRILLLEPSHFRKYPVSEKVLAFILAIAQNIENIQIYCGEFDQLALLCSNHEQTNIIFKEHPAFKHYKGVCDSRTWMFEEVNGYYPSFFAYWKRCKRFLK